jgi:hypothetical protein
MSIKVKHPDNQPRKPLAHVNVCLCVVADVEAGDRAQISIFSALARRPSLERGLKPEDARRYLPAPRLGRGGSHGGHGQGRPILTGPRRGVCTLPLRALGRVRNLDPLGLKKCDQPIVRHLFSILPQPLQPPPVKLLRAESGVQGLGCIGTCPPGSTREPWTCG